MKNTIMKQKKTYPKGHFIGVGIALGIPLGLPLALSLGNLGFIGLGIPFGLAIGIALEEDYKKKGLIREPTKQEIDKMKYGFILGITLLILFVVLSLLLIR